MDAKRVTFRMQFRFWLDIMRDDEHEIAEFVEEMKEKRSFAATIRDALRLIKDLRNGRVEVLLSLFPWIADHFAPSPLSTALVPTDDPIREQLAALTEMLLQQGALPFEAGQPPAHIAQLPASLPAEREDLDALDFEISDATHDENNRSDWNFMLASAMQVHGNCDGLPPEIIEYGLRTGRIKEHDVSRNLSPTGEVGGAMDVPQFAAPSFDDLDLSLDTG